VTTERNQLVSARTRLRRAERAADPAVASSARSFRTGQVARILGVSHRQLQYWAETGLVAPSARTDGGHCRYTFQDLVALRAAKQLIDAGVSVQGIRKSIGSLQRMLPTVRRPLSELVLVATGDLVLVLRDGSAFEAISGQEWILEVSRFEREIGERLARESEAKRRRPPGTAAKQRGETTHPGS
jgi:DNA-binding transcriptional MerR regulator